mmetsp:Transcript_16898/g.48179  ORF Transcript_16898/g.48179 Transcript_16898/m.48179 type:complete len:137 (+) Transcript_16898:752-1162(+)
MCTRVCCRPLSCVLSVVMRSGSGDNPVALGGPQTRPRHLIRQVADEHTPRACHSCSLLHTRAALHLMSLRREGITSRRQSHHLLPISGRPGISVAPTLIDSQCRRHIGNRQTGCLISLSRRLSSAADGTAIPPTHK